MTARDLARSFALRLADGSRKKLPRFADGADPLEVRAALQAFYLLHDAVIKERALLSTHNGPLPERIAFAHVQHEIEVAIAAARSWLSRVARLGGRGFDASEVTP